MVNVNLIPPITKVRGQAGRDLIPRVATLDASHHHIGSVELHGANVSDTVGVKSLQMKNWLSPLKNSKLKVESQPSRQSSRNVRVRDPHSKELS
jgi:hypothetical protein